MVYDAPPKFDPQPPVEYLIAQAADPAGHRLMAEVNTLRSQPAGFSNLPEVKDLGQIAEMKLPKGFVCGTPDSAGGKTKSFQEYHSSGDPLLKVYFEYRGHRMSEGSSKTFHQLLTEAPHTLRQAEVNKLTEVLQDKSDPGAFRISVSKTVDINGKRVLVVEGQYLQQGLQARTLFVDSDGTGSAVQEITFQAPVNSFSKGIVDGAKSLESIEWK